ncbi:hypothetical protein Cfor_03722 [Coptotermes formosanus]|uniref:DUF4817 domain-containing protein n=1 Tax=Coptotermes formosanus TaxID=36987 RepID=A0A6L2PU66_COPFO|nr:hypothetical protein Cfor_03722 [Coptotermes formosanus]
MDRWGVTEGVCAVELFIRTGSITETQRGFRRELNQQEAPSPNAIRRWVRQWREKGSVTCKNPPGRPSSVRTPNNIARVLASVSRRVTGPYFCDDEGGKAITVISHRYTEMINEFLSPNLPPSNTLWFQQDGATARTARVISPFGDVPRPPRSPDLTAPDFFLWLIEK